MMTDKEMLEWAARAAGDAPSGIAFNSLLEIGQWNPLTNDGDAFRLAVKLKLRIEWDGCEVQVFEEMYDSGNPICAGEVVHSGLDADSATRRAITRAASMIGKAMEGGE